MHSQKVHYLIFSLLLLAVTAIWLTVNSHWNPGTWRSPGGNPSGDILEVAARVQIAAEQFPRLHNTYGSIDRLGAPVGACWTSYPTPDRVTFALAGLISRVVGVFGAINFLMLVGHLLGASSFYFCTRLLKWHPALGAAGALLFSYAVFNQQWSGTLSLSWTFTLPPAVVLLQWIASRSATPPSASRCRMAWLAAGTGLCLGFGNPYFVFAVLQLLLFALLFQWYRNRAYARLRVGVIFLLALLLVFFLSHAPYFFAHFIADEVDAIGRNYAGSELYALKPIELFLPPKSHRIDAMAALGRNYSRITFFRSTEPIGSYLGLVGILGFVVIVFALLKSAVASRRKYLPVPDATLATLWILFLSCVGGMNSMLSFLSLDLFRASNRFSILVFIWCLFAAIGWMRRQTIRQQPRWTYIFSAVIATIGLFDLVPHGLSQSHHEAGTTWLSSERSIAARIVQAGGSGAKVFQLPAVPFPEAGLVLGFPDYDHLRLFLASPELKLSYGGLRGSLPERWNRWAAGLPARALVEELEQCGFSVLTIDQRAYQPYAFTQLTVDLHAAGLSPVALPESSHLIAFRLTPSATPKSPEPNDPRFYPLWDITASLLPDSRLSIHALQGWFDSEHDSSHSWRWAGHQAKLGLWNGLGVSQTLTLVGQMRGISPGWINLKIDNVRVLRLRLGSTATDLNSVSFVAAPGASILEWQFEGELVRPARDSRRLGFQLENFAVIKTR